MGPSRTPRIPRAASAALLLLSALTTSSCMVHSHQVGLGATGAEHDSARQFYFLFGLVPLNEVNVQRMTEDLTSYEIDTRFGWIDFALAPLLLPMTVTTRTVTVSR